MSEHRKWLARPAGRAWLSAVLLASSLLTPGLAIYYANATEFTFKPGTVLPGLLAGGAGLLILTAVLQLCLQKWKYFALLNSLILAAGVAVWWQTLFPGFFSDELVSSGPDLDGITLLQMMIQAIPLLIPFALACWQPEWVSRHGVRIVLIVLAAQWLPLLWSSQRRVAPKYDHYDYTVDEMGQFVFAREENTILLVVDCLSESLFKTLLREYPEVTAELKDFTCFDRMESPAPKTAYAVPAMLSGIAYSDEIDAPEAEPHDSYLRRACFAETSLLVAGQKAGVRTEAYPFILQAVSSHPDLLDNAVVRRGHSASLSYFFDLWLFRLLPDGAKWYLGAFFLHLSDRFVTPVETVATQFGGVSYDVAFYDRLQTECRIGEFPAGFKYFHLRGAHSPYRTNEKLLPSQDTSMLRQLRGSWQCVEKLLQEFKRLELYDRTLIVITGDHSERYTPEVVTLIKRPGDRQDHLRFNSISCEVADINRTILAERKWLAAESLFDRVPVASATTTRMVVEPNILAVNSWQANASEDESDLMSPFSLWQQAYQMRGNGLELEIPEDMVSGKLRLLWQEVQSGRKWQREIDIPAGKALNICRLESGNLPDGVYRLFLQAEKMLPVEEFSETIEQNWTEHYCFPAYLENCSGRLSRHDEFPGLPPRLLQPGETVFLHAMKLLPELEFGPEAVLKENYLSLNDGSQLGILLPAGSETLYLELELVPLTSTPAEIRIESGDRTLFRRSLSVGRNELTAVLTLSPELRRNEKVELRFRLEPRYRNRNNHPMALVQLSRISLYRAPAAEK